MASDDARRKKALRVINLFANKACVDKEDRLLIVRNMYYGYDMLESYSELPTDVLEEVAFMFKGWNEIQRARWATGVMATEAEVIIKRLEETPEESMERQVETKSWD